MSTTISRKNLVVMMSYCLYFPLNCQINRKSSVFIVTLRQRKASNPQIGEGGDLRKKQSESGLFIRPFAESKERRNPVLYLSDRTHVCSVVKRKQ